MGEPRGTRMTGRVPPERVLDLIHSYWSGKLWAYLSPTARVENALPLLTPAYQEVAEALLGSVTDAEALRLMEVLGHERSAHALRSVLAKPRHFNKGQLHLDLFLEKKVEDVTWLLAHIQIGITMMIVYTYVWVQGRQDDTAPLPCSVDRARWWDGFSRIEDDTGQTYVRLTDAVECYPEVEGAFGQEPFVRRMQGYRSAWGPGPPLGASVLVRTGNAQVRVPVRSRTDDQKVLREVELRT